MARLADLPIFDQPLLAIESSCDETAAAVLHGLKIRSSVVSSQIDLHQRTGGVVPEVAARAHVEAILPVLEEAVGSAGLRYGDLQAIAVTNRPGLVGSLSVGVSAAKALAYALRIPLLGIHHLEGHLLSVAAAEVDIALPYVCLLVSGGHTELVLVHGIGQYELLGQTRDDAAGEAFDKVARLLGIPYPGGRALSDLARGGNSERYRLPRGLEREATYDFSFSGLKTAAARLIESEGDRLCEPDAAASVEAAIVEPLVERTMRAARETEVSDVAVAGGVAANRRLRDALAGECARDGIRFVPAPLELCTDNAAMIGIAATFRLGLGERDDFSLDCLANSDLPGGR